MAPCQQTQGYLQSLPPLVFEKMQDGEVKTFCNQQLKALFLSFKRAGHVLLLHKSPEDAE